MIFLKRRIVVVLVIVALAAAGASAFRHFLQPPQLPAGFASGNGRLEATEFDIATKISGRLLEVVAHEGDDVRAGQILARLDSNDLGAALRQAQAQLQHAIETEKQTHAQVRQLESQYGLARKTLQRSRAIAAKGLIAKETVDQHETQMQSAAAALESARIGVRGAAAAVAAAQAAVERVQVNIVDSTLLAPVNGRVLYRLAEPGEVLPAGGKVLTLLDLSTAYMPIFLPAGEAGRVRMGAAARIVFDALPNVSVPAKVSFVAARAQFTPKEVETRSEREKLMFRVKVQVDPALLRDYAELVKTGVPGVAYVQLEPAALWPAWLPPPVARKTRNAIELGAQ